MTNDKKEQIFKWTSRKRDVAKHLAEGLLKQNDIADLCECTTAQISVWKRSPEFMDQIADYILVDERATKAGILQAALKGVRLKEADIEADKSTHLDYLKAVADIQGHNKGDTHNMNVNVGVAIVDDVPKPQKKQDAD